MTDIRLHHDLEALARDNGWRLTILQTGTKNGRIYRLRDDRNEPVYLSHGSAAAMGKGLLTRREVKGVLLGA